MTGTGHVDREVINLFRAVKDAAGDASLDLQAWETQVSDAGVRYKITGRLGGKVLVLPAMNGEEMVAALKGIGAAYGCKFPTELKARVGVQ